MGFFSVVENFYPKASLLRHYCDEHFSDPYTHNGMTHQIWNYWYVPGHYTYLRTDPQKIIPKPEVEAFVTALQVWTGANLGVTQVTWPHLSLYVNGCRQTLHNDVHDGVYGYVYSLTRWDERNFVGGETLLFRDNVYTRPEAVTQVQAGVNFYDLVPARFNQLLVFDDRIPHAVERIEGTMNPHEGRLALHGHIRL
jgi:hypothetical protein